MRSLRTLLSNTKIRLGMAAAVLGLAGVVAAPLANATVVSVYNDASTHDTLRFTIGCGSVDGDCSGLLAVLASDSPYTFDSTNPLEGSLFALPNQDPATEAGLVNAAAGTSFTTGTQTSAGGSDGWEFATSAEYFLIKTGRSPDNAVFHNISGGTLDLFYTQTTGTGSGFSHYTEFGRTVTVPEPAALGMFGLGALLIGLIAGLRRRYS
jgi:hypothetical protein